MHLLQVCQRKSSKKKLENKMTSNAAGATGEDMHLLAVLMVQRKKELPLQVTTRIKEKSSEETCMHMDDEFEDQLESDQFQRKQSSMIPSSQEM